MEEHIAIQYINEIKDIEKRECFKKLYFNNELCDEHIKNFDSNCTTHNKSCACCLENFECETSKIACRNCHHGIQDDHPDKILCCYYPFSIVKRKHDRCSFFYHKYASYREE